MGHLKQRRKGWIENSGGKYISRRQCRVEAQLKGMEAKVGGENSMEGRERGRCDKREGEAWWKCCATGV